MNLGFSTLEKVALAEKGQYSYKIPVLGGEKSIIKVENEDEFSIIKNKNENDYTTQINLTRYKKAPIQKGDIMGTVTFKKGNEIIGEIPLIASETVNSKDKKFFIF